MKLWLLKQDINNGYDTHDSAVVAAEDEAAARLTSIDGYCEWEGDAWRQGGLSGFDYKDWAPPHELTVTLLGEAAPDIKAGAIVASYNAS